MVPRTGSTCAVVPVPPVQPGGPAARRPPRLDDLDVHPRGQGPTTRRARRSGLPGDAGCR